MVLPCHHLCVIATSAGWNVSGTGTSVIRRMDHAIANVAGRGRRGGLAPLEPGRCRGIALADLVAREWAGRPRPSA